MLLVPAAAMCAPRSMAQMKNAAISAIFRSMKAADAARSGAAEPEVLRKGEQLTVIGYKAGGYAVIANDDRFDAVLGYSDTALPDSLPDNLRWWLETIDKAMKEKLAKGQKKEMRALPSDSRKESVSELLTTRWNQGAPYNNIVKEKLGGNFPVGCVATAMSQIMKYHNYPTTGQGSHTYAANGAGGSKVSISADFGNTEYRWDDMCDYYSYLFGRPTYTDEQADAVATLMYQCGVAVNMEYSLNGSGAYSNVAATALKDYFRYSTKFYTRDYFPGKEWMDIVYNELSSSRPILYGGVDKEGGHAFVLDGYDEAGLVHVNWGWSGQGDGFFDIATLGGYTTGQDMIIIIDGADPEYPIPYSSLWCQDGGLSASISGGKNLTYSVPAIYNFDTEVFTGKLALVAAPTGSGEPAEFDSQYTGNVRSMNGYRNYGGTADISSLPDGQYRVYLASKASKETAWQPVRSKEDLTNNYLLTIEGATATLEKGDSEWTASVSSVNKEDGNADGAVKVYTADGRMVYSADSRNFKLSDVPAKGLLIIKSGSNIKKVVLQ